MKKTLMSLMVVLVVFSFVAFATAQEKDPMEGAKIYPGGFQWVPGGQPWQLFIPHYDITSGWWSGLVLQNMDPTGGANQATINFCDDAGWVQGQVEVAFSAWQKISWWLTLSLTGTGKGWIVVESQNQLMGFVNFGTLDGSGKVIAVSTLGPFWSN